MENHPIQNVLVNFNRWQWKRFSAVGAPRFEHVPVAASSVDTDWPAESSTPSTVASVGVAASGRASGAASETRHNHTTHN